MDDFQQDRRGFNLYIAASLLVHGLLLLLVWKMPVEKARPAAPPPLPVYIVQESPPEPSPRVAPPPSVVRPPKPPPAETKPTPKPPQETPRPLRPLPDLPVTDELTDRPPATTEKPTGPSGSGTSKAEVEKSGEDIGDESKDGMEPASRKGKQPKVALYDPGVVGRVVGPAIPYGDVPEITLDTAEFKHLSYMYKLRDQIESIWVYPAAAVRRGLTGDLYIRFVILSDGSLGDVRLIRTSGYPELDEAAIQAVREAAPFLPLPKKWEVDTLAIKGHFFYSLSGYYLR